MGLKRYSVVLIACTALTTFTALISQTGIAKASNRASSYQGPPSQTPSTPTWSNPSPSALDLPSSALTTLLSIGLIPGGLTLNPPTIDHPFYVTSDKQMAASADLTPMVVTDATGTGAGWNVTVQASQVAVDSPIAAQRVGLPYGSLTLMAPDISTDNPLALNEMPTIVQNEFDIDSPSSAITVARATQNNGMGRWVFNFPTDCLRLSLGSAAHAIFNQAKGPLHFTTTLTWRVNCGP